MMNSQQVLESVETGLERMLIKSGISGDKDSAPGLRIALVYLRSRIDQCIDAEAASLVDRALPAPEQPAEAAQEPVDTQERSPGFFEAATTPPPQASRERSRE